MLCVYGIRFVKIFSFLGFDLELLNNFKVILTTMNCGHSVNAEAFGYYCKDVAKRYVRVYHWYPMPPSVHVILVHGYYIINKAVLPISWYSEEEQECNISCLCKKKFSCDFCAF